MRARQWVVSTVLLSSLLLLAAGAHHSASAADRWPPWQTFSEAEAAKHARLKRVAAPQQNDIDQLERKVSELRAAGKLAEATPLAAQVVRLTEKRNGPYHPATAAALTSYADLLIAQKRYAEAEPILKRVAAIREKSKDTAGAAQALDNLGQVYDKQGRGGDAKSAHERATAMRSPPSLSGGLMAKKGKLAPPPTIGAAQPASPAKPAAPPQVHAESRPLVAKPEAKPMPSAPAPNVNAMRRDSGRAEMRRFEERAEPSGGASGPAIMPSPPPAPAPTMAAPPPPPLPTPQPSLAMPPPAAAPAPPPPPHAEMMRREAAPSAPESSEEAPSDGAMGGAAPDMQPAPPPSLRSAGPNLDAKSGGGGGMPRAADRNPGGAASGGAASPPAAAAAPPPLAGGAAPKDQAWDVVPVYYGTDRAEEPNAKRVSFSSDRGRRLQLGQALVTVPKSHEVPQVERPWAIRIPYFDVTIYEQAEDPNKHFTMQEIKKLSKDDFLALVHQRLANSARFKDEALVFVHGYNTSFDNAVYRTAQIAYDLKFDGAPFLYSWPSGGGIASYTYDRESAEASKAYMRQFLDLVVKETGAKSISIIAHSMGNQPLLDVLKDMKYATPSGVVISQVILAAPDVDADSFSDLAQAINGFAKGVTLYAAGNDRALQVSRNFWGNYRAGDVPATGPLIIPGIDTIDVTGISTDTFALNHSDYAQHNELLKDIGELIATGLRPPEQREMKPERVTTDKGDYWRYAPRSGP